MNPFRFFYLAGAFVIIVSTAAAQEKLNFSDATQIALENNFSIKLAEKSTVIAENNFNVGSAGMLPRIDANAGSSYSKSDINMDIVSGQNINQTGNVSKNYNAAVELNWTLFDGFYMFAQYDKLRELLRRSDIELQMESEALISDLLTAYYEAARLEKSLEVARESYRISLERLDRIREKIEFGAALNLERLQARVDADRDSVNLLRTSLALSLAKRNLNFLMNRDLGTEFSIAADTNLPGIPVYEELRSDAFSRNTALNRALTDRAISEQDLRAARAAYYPSIGFNTGYSYSLQESDAGFMLSNENKGYSVGARLQWNLFDGLQTSTRAQNAAVGVEMSEIGLDLIESQIELRLANALDNYAESLEIVELSRSSLAAARENFERSQEFYDLGRLTSVEFRTAQLNLRRAENEIFAAIYQAKIAYGEALLVAGRKP